MRSTRSLFLCLLLSVCVSGVLSAAPREREREPKDPLKRIVRIVKKVFGVSTNGDSMIPPTP